MREHISELDIPDVLLIRPPMFKDERGSFVEIWHAARAALAGLTPDFVQDNVAYSRQGVLRGLHFQQPHAQGKYVTAVLGEIYDVAVDLRAESPNFGDWVAVRLSAEQGSALYIPPGFAHGYQVLSHEAVVVYKCTDYYHADADRSIAWNDPQLNVSWPLPSPILSEKDRRAPSFAAVCRELGLPAVV